MMISILIDELRFLFMLLEDINIVVHSITIKDPAGTTILIEL